MNEVRWYRSGGKLGRTVSTTNSRSPFLSTLATIPRDSRSLSFSFSFSDARKANSDLIEIPPGPFDCRLRHISRRLVSISSRVLALLDGTGRGISLLARLLRDRASTADVNKTTSVSGSLKIEALPTPVERYLTVDDLECNSLVIWRAVALYWGHGLISATLFPW